MIHGQPLNRGGDDDGQGRGRRPASPRSRRPARRRARPRRRRPGARAGHLSRRSSASAVLSSGVALAADITWVAVPIISARPIRASCLTRPPWPRCAGHPSGARRPWTVMETCSRRSASLRASRLVAAVTGAPQHVVVMGVSGSGKTTVGEALAAALGWRFVEGDSFHPPANVAKMSAGIPLDDADRGPWLAALAAEIAARRGGRAVVGGRLLVAEARLPRHPARRRAAGALPARPRRPGGAGRAGVAPARALLSGRRCSSRSSRRSSRSAPDEDGVVVDVALPVEAQVAAALEASAFADGAPGALPQRAIRLDGGP